MLKKESYDRFKQRKLIYEKSMLGALRVALP